VQLLGVGDAVSRFAALLFAILSSMMPVTPGRAAACAHATDPLYEARSSRYVFEGRLESFGGRAATFVVTAIWKGMPPARLTVRFYDRLPRQVGSDYLVFARGSGDDALIAGLCTSSGLLRGSARTVARIEHAGLVRTAREHD
jgi:hypothetical protein